jgi:hypothetical protein
MTLCVVAAYNNELRWKSRLANFRVFEDHMAATPGVRLVTVECAAGNLPFELPDRDGVVRVRVRSNDMIWRKENLQNVGFRAAGDWDYGLAIDGDLFWHDPTWAARTVDALQHHRIVQVSSDIVWLGPKDEEFAGHGKSLMFWYERSRRAHGKGQYWHKPGPVVMLDNGYPGGAWAFRHDAFEAMGGLLDICLLGAADYHAVYAMLGLRDALLDDNDYTPGYRQALAAHGARAARAIDRDVGLVAGTVYHLWHGPLHARRYATREQILIRNHYDPATDIVWDGRGVMHLAGNKPRLRDDIRDYFAERDEDSVDTKPPVPEAKPVPYHRPTITLFAVPPVIVKGRSTTLRWRSHHATSVHGINWTAVGLDSVATVTPAKTTRYEIVATGPGGTATAEATVEVIGPFPFANE